MTEQQGILAWALGSAGLMVIGAFGPWAEVLAVSVGGTDGSNDGWLVVGFALLGGLLVYARRTRRSAGTWAIVTGSVGAVITVYDRHNVTSAISSAGGLGQALGHVGWGLNLAMLASVSLAISGLAWLARVSNTDGAEHANAAVATTSAAAPTVPAGWYRDPNDPGSLRYWDGAAWTTQTATPAS